MALFSDPFDSLTNLQRALDMFRASGWLDSGPSGGGSYPPMNVFRKDDDIIIIAEVAGIEKSSLDVQVKGNTVRVAGTKTISYPERSAMHRRERPSGRFDRAVTLPVGIDHDRARAECRDGILVLFLPRAEHDKPRSVQVA